MQIVIDIDEDYVRIINKNGASNYPEEVIKNGTPLPKGHGRIMDVDKVIKKMEEREEKLKDDRSMWETAGVETALDMFGETIIEEDKTEKEKSKSRDDDWER